MKKGIKGLLFICCISYSSPVIPMSKMRFFLRKFCRNDQLRELLIPYPDEETTKKLKNKLLTNEEARQFSELLERNFLLALLEIDDTFVEEDALE